MRTRVGRVRVRVGGKADGPAMAFWPSVLMDGSMWAHQCEHYAPTHRLVVIDAPGIGRSDPLRRPVTLEDSAACLLAVLDALEVERCLLVGCSWGGLLASVFPAWHPRRLTGSVVICGTAMAPTLGERVQMTVLSTVLGWHGSAPKWLAGATRSAFAGGTAKRTKPEFIAYLGRVVAEDPKSVAFAMKGIVLGRVNRHDLLAQIRDVPVLVLAGEEDAQFPAELGRDLARSIAGSRFAVLPATGHLAARESPDLVNTEIDAFIAHLPRPAAGTRDQRR